MKVAVPVKDDSLKFFGNAGHTPYFAIFAVKGGGMFKAFDFEETRKNPRTDLDHDHSEEDHHCSHDHDDEEHVKQHMSMGEVLEDCDYLVVQRACKNTALAMKNYGVGLIKHNGDISDVKSILSSVAAQIK